MQSDIICWSFSSQNGGAECSGCGTEFETCGSAACGESKRVTTWTPWLQANETDVGRIERRFRFSCKAPVDVAQLKTGPLKLEERLCHPDGTCIRTESGLSEGISFILVIAINL